MEGERNPASSELICCSKCDILKDPEEFYNNITKKTKKDCYCKQCRKKVDIDYKTKIMSDPTKQEKRKQNYINYRIRIKQKNTESKTE